MDKCPKDEPTGKNLVCNKSSSHFWEKLEKPVGGGGGGIHPSGHRKVKTYPLVNASGNFLAPAVKYMICMAQTPSVCDDEIYKDFVRLR